LDKDLLNTAFKQNRGNRYFYGEIFIDNDNIVPDSGRQGLAAGEEADALMLEIKRYFSDTLGAVYYRANKLKTALKDAKDFVNRLNNPEFEIATIQLTEKLREHIDKFNKAATPDDKEEINDVISIYQNKYSAELKSEVEKYLVPHQKQQEDEYDNIDMVPEPKVSEPVSSRIPVEPQSLFTPEISPEIKPTPIPSQKQQTVTPSASPIITLEPKAPAQPKSIVDEILSSLEGKNYPSEQVDLLKKVFSTMLVVCSSSQKKNVVQLMEIAVNSLK
jgi:molecular chaperone HtpG